MRTAGILCSIVMVILLSVSLSHAAEISNTSAKQSGNRVLFEYDVTGEGEADVVLTVTVNGKTYDAGNLKLEGDYGKVRAGKGKKIYWNVLQDFPRGLNTKIDWEIKAEDKQTVRVYQNDMGGKNEEKNKSMGKMNKSDEEQFLRQNANNKGVLTLRSGLQYKVIKEGTGRSPKKEDIVTVHYRGTFLDGTEFDSSYKRGTPATFSVNGVIPGWVEALQLMKEGAKWQLVIPSKLAYGERGAGTAIPPNTTLMFEVELISIK